VAFWKKKQCVRAKVEDTVCAIVPAHTVSPGSPWVHARLLNDEVTVYTWDPWYTAVSV
jgi:hypothetical protein